jgi:hypothetical protein
VEPVEDIVRNIIVLYLFLTWDVALKHKHGILAGGHEIAIGFQGTPNKATRLLGCCLDLLLSHIIVSCCLMFCCILDLFVEFWILLLLDC